MFWVTSKLTRGTMERWGGLGERKHNYPGPSN